MDDATHEVFANREEPIPVFRPHSFQEGDLAASSHEAEHQRKKHGKLMKKIHDAKDKLHHHGSAPETWPSVQDRFFSGFISQILPTDGMSDDEEEDAKGSAQQADRKRGREQVERPPFSLPLMSTNFRRFNARVGVLFAFQNQLIYLFTWRHPNTTLSFVAVHTLLCLQPSLLPVLPLVGLLFMMIPSFLARHPVPANDPRVEPSYLGPAIAPPNRVKPAPEMSNDFFRNMRDLQNCMEDFSTAHDAAIEYIAPYTNFSDEAVSSLLFTSVFGLTCVAFIGSHLIPWRAVALLAGYVVTFAGHPEVQTAMSSPTNVSRSRQLFSALQNWIRTTVESDISLDSPPEIRQVEIFELQKYHTPTETWEPWLFSPSPYDPLSSIRISGARAKGTQFFEDVLPPSGWAWKEKKWHVDIWSREWVEQRMITGVEVEMEGERWVYDLPTEEVERLEISHAAKGKHGKKGHKKGKEVPKSGWEEGAPLEKRGEWRRRRWVRLVKRKPVVSGNGSSG